MKKKGTNLLETAADVDRALVKALSDEQVEDPMSTTPSVEEQADCGNDAKIMMKIGKSEIMGSVAEEADRI